MAVKKTRPSAKADGPKYPRKDIPCNAGSSVDEQGRNYAELLTSPELAAFRVTALVQPSALADKVDAPTMLDVLRDQAGAVQGGDMARPEAMLSGQATALQSLFVRLTELAMLQNRLPNIDGLMRVALRAQSQCRATLETLSAIKNPPIVYAKQANVTTGPQQNNFVTEAPMQAGEKKIEPIRLSIGDSHELYQNTRTSGHAGKTNPAMETLAEVNRP